VVAIEEKHTAEADRERLPGDVDVWVFVFADLASFAFYFVVFMIYRVQHPALFLAEQQHLDVELATVNTLVLLASSRCVAKAILVARRGDHDGAVRHVVLGISLGVVFAVIKTVEWCREISLGYTLPRNEFWMFYFALTGVHLFHVLIGLVVLAALVRELRHRELRRQAWLESGALYWHMVDLVWVFVFATLYLMR